jgi:hypothetical protein
MSSGRRLNTLLNCSSFSQDEIYKLFADYLGTDGDDAQVKIEEFINCEPEDLNQRQRIILVSKEFHSEVISAVLWLRESEIDIECIRLTPYRHQEGDLFRQSNLSQVELTVRQKTTTILFPTIVT